MAEKTMALKLLIDTKANRVLFAEAGKEVVDFLFSLLALPLGSIVKLVSKDQMVGSIGSIYSSLENLDSTYMQPNQDKDILLSPHLQQQKQRQNHLCLPSPAPAKVKAYYGCPNFHHKVSCYDLVSEVRGISCPSCGRRMERVLKCLQSEPGMKTGNGEAEDGYVKGVVTYTVMDDLSVMPMSSIASITLLNKFNAKTVNVFEEKYVSLGIQEALELLKASFESKTVLTDVFLAEANGEANVLCRLIELGLHFLCTMAVACSSQKSGFLGGLWINKTMTLKLVVHTKANRVLFAEADKQVVDFLFGLLALPLGSIVKVLGKDQMVGSIGCIYSSLENLDSTYIQPDQDKNILLNPQLQQQKQCLNNLLLPSPAPAKLKAFYGCHNIRSKIQCRNYVSEVCGIDCPSCSGTMERVFEVFASCISSITLFNEFNVKNADTLEEKNVSLGKQEAVDLLKASLKSKTVLTDANHDILFSLTKLSTVYSEEVTVEDLIDKALLKVANFKNYIMKAKQELSTEKFTTMAEKTLVLKLLIDTRENRVLFAEAGKEVVDFLFSLLALPLGFIVKLLSKDQMVGSIGSIYSSLQNLDSTYIQPNQDKDILLGSQEQEQIEPQNNLLLSVPIPPKVNKYYGCNNRYHNSSCYQYVTKVCGIQCPSCGDRMGRVIQFVNPESGTASGNGGGEGYVKGVVTYTIMDDLSVTPMSTISCITLLSKFNVTNVDVLKEKNVSLGTQEALELLEASLGTKTVLTDVFLANEE
ncbi:uncharacterized protein LOC120273314 [Dioscorea cayenensis subsp. rotundata]|uniref:Uncharacterized protein LOC120273314 n=1 Tax=Dioscorea cayennensis subsp. rotundata TaxID=55577 RepID=A0AB40C7P8_DIOCR|nr:uncharacterized protein LOC120273314 [Dioscorea cayenensis subsp. rotundata]